MVGTETIEMPAGKFQVIKIESEGDWLAQVEQVDTAMIEHPQKIGPAQMTRDTYKAFCTVAMA